MNTIKLTSKYNRGPIKVFLVKKTKKNKQLTDNSVELRGVVADVIFISIIDESSAGRWGVRFQGL